MNLQERINAVMFAENDRVLFRVTPNNNNKQKASYKINQFMSQQV
jgi:hypothetical protein